MVLFCIFISVHCPLFFCLFEEEMNEIIEIAKRYNTKCLNKKFSFKSSPKDVLQRKIFVK